MTSPTQPKKRATIIDVAHAAGVSRGTVSRVLNGERYVSDEARVAIEAAIIAVGYVPNTAARNLVMQRSQAVGFVVHEPHSVFLEDPNIGDILLGANEALSVADYQMVCLIVGSGRDTERVARYLSGGYVDGAIIVSARDGDPIPAALARSGLPSALIGRPSPGLALPYVGIDNRAAAAAITMRLRETGRRRIGMLAAALDRDSGQDRLAGFTDALGAEADPRLIVELPLYSFSEGRGGMQELLRRDPEIDGVFAASDAVAAGALDALREAGRRVPEDVGVVGFDDSSWARRTTPPLSTVHQNATALGQAAAGLVLDQLSGTRATLRGHLLETPVVWRESA